ncbi:hypothetical protein BC938DRAFT_473859 [Jimgerdemannia flammicorona]|uniref:Uncharacterized protein n=1 Tax=Jimgerdemannia flammicorona TaxID=994334 RepID=A0A433Q3B8_9FUNG|nr:hypothetical protein BC938DRAFT_473859 [Jimgerdemannia flammicorona]
MDNTNQLDILIIFASHAALNKRLGRAQTSSPRSYNPAYAAWQPAQGFVAFQRLSCHRRCPGSKREWRGYARDGRARDEGAQMLGTECEEGGETVLCTNRPTYDYQPGRSAS